MKTSTESSIFSGFAIGFIVLCLAVFVLHVARPIMVPFVIAVFVWYLLNAIARALGALVEIPRYIRLLFAILLLGCGLYFVVHLVSNNIADVMRAAPEYQANFQRILIAMAERFHLDHEPSFAELVRFINIGHVVTVLAGTFTGIAGKTLIVVFYTGFLLYEQKYFDRKIITMIKDQATEDHVRAILKKIDSRIQRYIGIKSFVSALDSFLTYVILSVAGVDFAEFWGLMAFFLHFIPYAGSFLAITVPSVIALIQFGDPVTCFIVVACLCISHAFLGHVLDPFLMGNNLNLSPIFIISSLAMCGMIWGIPGVFLAVPILAIITIILSQFPATRPMAILLSKTGDLGENSVRRGERFRKS